MPNSNLKLILFSSCFILSLAPIGIETSILYNNFDGLHNIFNFFRLTIPILIFFLLIFYYLKKKIKYKLFGRYILFTALLYCSFNIYIA